jgi:hypothetical protein
MKTNRTASPAAQEARRRRTAMTFEWLHGVNEDPGLQPCDLKVALALTKHFNEDRDGGAAWPSYKTIADEIGMSEHSVIRSVRRLSARGHLRVEWGQQGRGHPNRYWMAAPGALNGAKPARVHVSGAVKPAPAPAVKPAPVTLKPAPVQENLLKNHPTGVAKATPCREGERETRRGARSSPPAAARAPERGAAAGRSIIRERGQCFADAAEEERIVRERGQFRELRAAWTRPWPDNDDAEARRAFAKALDEGTDAGEIITAAAEWVRCADAPRFLPTLSKWLIARGWERPPPQKRARAKGRRAGGRSRTRGEESVAIALRIAGFTEQADGTMARELPDGFRRIWGGVQ